MAVQEKFRGVFPAFYACYDDEGNVSRERAAGLAKFYQSKGITGLYVTGSAGECVLQSVEERKATLEAVMDAVGGKMTVIAHVAAPSTADSIALAQHAESLGVDALAMVPGIYYRLNPETVRKYWMDVLNATKKVPLFIYNIPGTTNGFNLPTPLFEEMLATGRIAGIKNSSNEVQDILRFRVAGGEDVAIFNGPDEQYLAGRLMGASGGIGGTYGFMPELYLKLENLIRAGDIDKAYRLQKEITGVVLYALKAASMRAAAKGVLRLRGIETGDVRAPLLPLRPTDGAIIETVWERIQDIDSRY